VGVPVQVPVYSIGYAQQQYPPPPVQFNQPDPRQGVPYSMPGAPSMPNYQPDCMTQLTQLVAVVKKLQVDFQEQSKALEECKVALDLTRKALRQAQADLQKEPPPKASKKSKKEQDEEDDDENNGNDDAKQKQKKKKQKPKQDDNDDNNKQVSAVYFPRLAEAKCAACHSGQPLKKYGNLSLFPEGVDRGMRQLSMAEIEKIRDKIVAGKMPPPDNDKGIHRLSRKQQDLAVAWLDTVVQQIEKGQLR
jgi:hypothetical protein